MKKIGSCSYCGTITELIHDLCPECHHEEQNTLIKVREILKAHPNLNAIELSKIGDIPIENITRLIKNGLLAVKEK